MTCSISKTIPYEFPGLERIRAFLVLADQLHFGRAARRLHISQPALSQQIAAFEREVGLVLFSRSTRSVYLTQAGTDLLNVVRPAVECLTVGLQEVHRRVELESRTVTVGHSG